MTDLMRNKRALTGWPMVIGWIAMLIFALQASTHMVGAGDTWVAMACGRHFIDHGVDTNEPFSANSHRMGPTVEEVKTWPNWAQWITDKVGLDTVKYWHPTGWVNQNWLTHVIFYWLTHLSPFADAKDLSFNSLVYWKFAIYILTVICVYYTGRILGVNPALSAIAACAAMFIGRSFLDIRPAGFSNLLVSAFALILVLATYRNYLYIWLVVPATIFWANMHGGYIYVFIALAPVVVLRMLTTLPKRWTVSMHSILTWLALYAAMYKYTSHEPFTAASPGQDKFLILMVAFAIASIVLAKRRATSAPAFYAYHIVVSLIVFFVLLARFFPPEIQMVSPEAADYVDKSRQTFVIAFAAAVALGLVVTLWKNRLVSVSPAALWHTAAAGFAAFVGSIIFNPFHLTNLTHTFQISISENAEGWRNVHEWWPAFRWDNPVGTAFPFMVILLICGIGLVTLALFGRLLAPRQLKGSKTEMEEQRKRFNVVGKIVGYATAVFVLWTVMISFSFIEASVPSFLLCGLFTAIMLASVLANVHFVYMATGLILFAIFTGDASHGYTGKYIYPFLMVPVYVMVYLVGSRISAKAKYSGVNVLYVLGAAVVSLVSMAWLFNPFQFKEPVWHAEQFIHLHRMWAPIYEANLDLIYTYLFPALYIINALCVAMWIAMPAMKGFFGSEAENISTVRPGPSAVSSGQAGEEAYQLPPIDLALITVAAMTVYMALQSRRFITIAGYVGCPVIAMLLEQFILTVAASLNFARCGRLTVPPMSVKLQRMLTVTAAVVVVGLGVGWGLKFKAVYLDPTPFETKLTSVFIRMTASREKPFDACQFINLNKMRGNMFNYWTEGGFIASAQQPDLNTGRTPLQLFMDGRRRRLTTTTHIFCGRRLCSAGI